MDLSEAFEDLQFDNLAYFHLNLHEMYLKFYYLILIQYMSHSISQN
jgi:hypothetical protein